jgi:hypothetical protein
MPRFDPGAAIDLPPLETPWPAPELTVCGLFAKREQVTAAIDALSDVAAPSLSVGRLDRLLIARRTATERRDRDRLRRAMETAGAVAVDVDFNAEEEYLAISVTWQAKGEAATGITAALDAYLSLPYYLYLRAPWVPADVAPPLSTAEERHRAIVLELLVQSSPSDLGAYTAEYLTHMSHGAVDRVRELMTRQVEQHRASSERRAAQLRTRYPDAPPELFDRFLGSLLGGRGAEFLAQVFESGAPQPDDVYGPGAALGELLGQMRLDWPSGRAMPEVVDPAEAFQAHLGRTTVGPGGHRLEYVNFRDTLYGLPAMLRFLAERGAEEIEYETIGFEA